MVRMRITAVQQPITIPAMAPLFNSLSVGGEDGADALVELELSTVLMSGLNVLKSACEMENVDSS